jgi:hypothetical protein
MIGSLIARLSYANVVATLALFLALGGGAYAAVHLPRGSVGSAQIRAGAVGSREVRNHALHVSDLSTSARALLRGQRGAPGPAGPTGTSATAYFAVVGTGGQFLRGNGTFGSHTDGGSGLYTVGFDRDVSACAYSATLGTADDSVPLPGFATVRSDTAGRVLVQVTDATGTPKDLPFHLIVAC